MGRTGRRGLSAEQKAELWERRKRGESLSEIARALAKCPGSVFGILKGNGGSYRAPRRRAEAALSFSEREEISRGIAAGRSIRAIAAAVDRSPSTISREIVRNGGRSRYRAAAADSAAWDRACRPKHCKRAQNRRLRRIVAKKLQRDWSPEQICGWLKRTYPHDESLRVSHETIYRSLFVQARGVLKREWVQHLRSRRVMRRSKRASTEGQPRGQIVDGVSIRERPASVEDRAIPGH